MTFALAACSSQQSPPETATNDGSQPPNSADVNQEAMKASENEAEEMREESAEEATENVDNASVVETHPEALKTDDVDTDPND